MWLDRPLENKNNAADYYYSNSSPPVTKSCPTCNQNLLYSNSQQNKQLPSMMMGGHTVLVKPLQTCQPLAHRVLKSVLVECPLQGVDCHWKGDYGDLQSHLLSKTAHNNKQEPGSDNDNNPVATEAATTTTTTTSSNDPMDESGNEHHNNALLEQAKERNRALAASFKEEANSQFSSGRFTEARNLYTRALSVMIGDDNDSTRLLMDDMQDKQLIAALYSNRAATNLNLKEYNACVDDCRSAIAIDPTYTKAYVRLSRAYIAQGQFERACQALKSGMAVDTTSTNLLRELQKVEELKSNQTLGNQQLQAGEYASAKATFGNLLRETSGAPVVLGAAKADLGMGLTDSALRLTMRVLTNHPQSPEGCQVRGQTVFLMGDLDVGLKLLREALRLDPESSSIKTTLRQSKQVKELMETAKQKVFHRQFQEAVDLLTRAIELCQPLPPKAHLYADVYTQRAEANLRLKKCQDALKDCALVLYSQEDYVPAWLVKFQAYHGLGRHEQALSETTDLLGKWGSGDDRIRNAHENADFQFRKQNRPDFYAVLGVSPIASEMEIKKAYKKRAMELHPDKQPVGATDAQRKEAERQFHLLSDGLEILCDDFKRQLYDNGYDQETIRDRVAAAQRAAHMHRGGGGGGGHGHF
jgi:DnaJ family protein C protein 7